MKRLLLLATLLLLPAPALAQVPPTGSGTNGWLQAIYNILGGGVGGTANPRFLATAVFTGADTSSQNAALGNLANKFTYICGFTVSGLGATSIATVIVTVGTLTQGNTFSYSYVMPTGAAVPATPLNVAFNPCVAASGTATGITVTVPGAAGNTATQINVWGYIQ